jgi:hypothetical protein
MVTVNGWERRYDFHRRRFDLVFEGKTNAIGYLWNLNTAFFWVSEIWEKYFGLDIIAQQTLKKIGLEKKPFFVDSFVRRR